MKIRLSLLFVLCLSTFSLRAQVTVVSPAPALGDVVEVRTFNTANVQRQLSMVPRMIVATPVAVVPAPAPTVQTTTTTTVVETPGQPRRVYNSERSVVIVEDQGQSVELPYVTLPVLFIKETAELLDIESRFALQEVAGVIMALNETTPGTRFAIEGHTSTDGTDEFNLSLSASRAKRIFDELTQRYGVPASMLNAQGYGENFPMYPQGNEAQMQQDRRVLVVRTK